MQRRSRLGIYGVLINLDFLASDNVVSSFSNWAKGTVTEILKNELKWVDTKDEE
jgi:hypothetical protein